MVLGGQDAWRKHPLLAECHKVPFPHLGLAIGIFSVYLVTTTFFKVVTGLNFTLAHIKDFIFHKIL